MTHGNHGSIQEDLVRGNDSNEQLSLFVDPSSDSEALEKLLANGASYDPSFLTPQQSGLLIAAIDSQGHKWENDFSRRVQHYGWHYEYSQHGTIRPTDSIPDFLEGVCEEMLDRGWFEKQPNQVLVNEYEPGQGIGKHKDRDCFGPAVATLTLGDCWPMQFILPDGESFEFFLEVGSVLVMDGDVRSKWLHTIYPRKNDKLGFTKRPRRRRVSVTFRTIV